MKEVHYIPKLENGTLIDFLEEDDIVSINSYTANYLKNSLLPKLKEKDIEFVIYPCVQNLFFKDSKKTSRFKKLGYKKCTLEKVKSDSSFRYEEIIEKTLKLQIELGAEKLMAPAIFAENADDGQFFLNITLLIESIKWVKENVPEKEIFANIILGNRFLVSQSSINYVIDRYREYEGDIGGFFVLINDLNHYKAHTEPLGGLTNFVYQLAESKPVYVRYAGSFGLVLIAVGARGFSGGIREGETFDVKLLQEKPEKGGASKHNRTYVPEIMSYVSDSVLKEIDYVCSCDYCEGKGGRPESDQDKNRHFFACRKSEVKEVTSKKSLEERLDLLEGKVKNAIAFIENVKHTHAQSISNDYLEKWLIVIEQARHWEYDSEDKAQLEELLNVIDEKKD